VKVIEPTIPQPQTVLESLDRRRFLVSSWPWRSLVYVLTGLLVTFVLSVPLGLVIAPWARWNGSGWVCFLEMAGSQVHEQFPELGGFLQVR
jgi:hypothetical protein